MSQTFSRKIRVPKIPGRGLGRQIGFPTFNFAITPALLAPALPTGVFAGFLNQKKAVIFCGPRKSFDQVFALEVHLLNFQDEDLIEAEIAFGPKIRAIQKFATLSALQKQIQKDCVLAGRILANGN